MISATPAAGTSMMEGRTSRRNLRTALVLLSIALAFFVVVVVKYWLMGNA